MAYFKSNDPVPEENYQETEKPEVDYDDGFDKMEEEEYLPEMTDEEKAERTRNRIRLAFGAGNLFGIIAGTVLILLLLTLIFSIVHFVVNDMGRNFSLFQTNF